MTPDVEEIIAEWGPPAQHVPVPEERFERFSGEVPNLLLQLWRELGYSGFGEGMWWLCDPVVWQPTVDFWTAGVELPVQEDRWTAVARSAFGMLSLWGRHTGMSLKIVPHRGWLLPTDQSDVMATDDDRDSQVYAVLCSYTRKSLDLTGDDDQPLFERALLQVGQVGIDTMYGFVPALSLGGVATPDHLQVLDAEVHLQILREVSDIQVLDNPYL